MTYIPAAITRDAFDAALAQVPPERAALIRARMEELGLTARPVEEEQPAAARPLAAAAVGVALAGGIVLLLALDWGTEDKPAASPPIAARPAPERAPVQRPPYGQPGVATVGGPAGAWAPDPGPQPPRQAWGAPEYRPLEPAPRAPGQAATAPPAYPAYPAGDRGAPTAWAPDPGYATGPDASVYGGESARAPAYAPPAAVAPSPWSHGTDPAAAQRGALQGGQQPAYGSRAEAPPRQSAPQPTYPAQQAPYGWGPQQYYYGPAYR